MSIIHKIEDIRNLVEYQDKIYWRTLSRYGDLSEDFIREFKSKVYWQYIKRYQDLSKDFKIEFKDRLL